MKDEHFDVAQTRKCSECGSDEEMRWLALHPSCTELKEFEKHAPFFNNIVSGKLVTCTIFGFVLSL